MQKVLIIEDDQWILNSLKLYFVQSNFKVELCDNWLDAISKFQKFKPDIIILDINLPWKNGMDICKEIREKYNTPIIILSARLDEEDKVLALDLWADDYVSKPFSPRELLARINSVLKRFSNIKNSSESIILFKDISLDVKNFSAQISWKIIKTTKTEFMLLKYIIENRDEVILREKLMKDIMWYDNYLYDRTIDTHIKNLRKKVGDSLNIETIRWIGYKIS